MSVFDTIKDPFAGGRRQENQDKARFQESSDTMRSIGDTEMSKYQDPKLSDAQTKELDDYSGEMGAATKDFYGRAGKSGSSAEIESMQRWANDVSGMKYDMEELQKESSWQKGIQALGLSQDSARRITQMNEKDRQEKTQLFSGFMGAAAGLIRMGA